MSFGGGHRNPPEPPGWWYSPDPPEDDAEQTFEFRWRTPDDYRAQAGRTGPPPVQPGGPRHQGRTPTRRRGMIWLLAAGIMIPVAAGIVIGLLVARGPTPPAHTSTLEDHALRSHPPAHHTGSITNTGPATNASTGPGKSARCPVGTLPTAVAIANALARDPVYAQRGSRLLTVAQTRRLRAEIGRQDPGRIRIAAVTPATVRRGGGERALTNAIASCPGDAAGTTLVTTGTSTYLVTSYANPQEASQAVAAALNTHVSLAAGLMDAVRRVTIVDKDNR
jgi:hypothetical protein